MSLIRIQVGDVLRRRRQLRGWSLRDVSGAAAVSAGYLSEIERGEKEASSEMLTAICGALEFPLSDMLHEVASAVEVQERSTAARVVADPATAGASARVRKRAVVPTVAAATPVKAPKTPVRLVATAAAVHEIGAADAGVTVDVSVDAA